jgi:SAM-dependent methyltransferase
MSKAELDKFYEEEYREIYHESERPNIDSEQMHAQHAYNIICGSTNQNIKTALDIGCSSGQLITLLRANGIKAEGVEKSQYKTGGVYADISEVNSTYDVITMLNTLEHVYSPTETLQSVYNLLNDSGYLLISVPDLYNANIKRPIDAYLSNAHLYTFSPHTLGMMLNKCGFAVEGFYSVPEEIGDKLYALARKAEPIEIEWDMHADTASMKAFLQYVDAVFIGQYMFKKGGCHEHKNNS